MTSESNFPQTGGLQPMTTTMRSIRASIPRPSTRPSSTTSPKGEGETRSALSPVGRAVTASGAIPTRIESRQTEVVRAFGIPQTEATLAHLLAPLLVWSETSRFSGDEFAGTDLRNIRVVTGAKPATVERALAQAERICKPAGPSVAGEELAHLRVLTVHRDRDAKEMELMAVAYTQRLAEFPVDVVRAACKAWADREEFWPSWAELKAECDKRMRGRLQIREALRAFR